MPFDAKTLLSDPALFQQSAYINGGWVAAASGATIEVDNPATGEIIGSIPDCGAAETQAAVDAAEAAFPAWAARTAADRAALLERWFDLMIAHKEDLARLMTLEQGKPLAESRGEIGYGASFVKWYAEEGKRVYGETIPATVPGRKIIVQKHPIGVSAAITPWNFPNAMITRKAAPALAAGCTMVVKPSELTPFSALAIAELATRAGIPAGVLNIVTGYPQAIGGVLTESPVVRKLSFTGSTRVGKILMEQCAGTVKKLSLELGGNAPFLIFDDADLDKAVDGVMASKFRNAGQTCVCANRVYVQAGVYDAFAAKLAEKTAALSVGDGMEDGIEIGPLINDAAVAKAESHLADAAEKGGTVVVGGARAGNGRFLVPAVVTGATSDMLVADEETFGPVAPLFRFETEAEAISAANGTPFGLAAYLFTENLGRSFRVGDALEAGIISINTGAFSTEVAPFGGVKESGLGREGAHHGIDEYLEVKAYHIDGI